MHCVVAGTSTPWDVSESSSASWQHVLAPKPEIVEDWGYQGEDKRACTAKGDGGDSCLLFVNLVLSDADAMWWSSPYHLFDGEQAFGVTGIVHADSTLRLATDLSSPTHPPTCQAHLTS
jgi:hypothetical protein